MGRHRRPSTPLTDAQRTLIETHLYLLDDVAYRIPVPRCVQSDDMRQAGYFGLMRAAEDFDPARGVKFTTFAQHKIKGAILDYLRDIDPNTRLMRRRGQAIQTHSLSAKINFRHQDENECPVSIVAVMSDPRDTPDVAAEKDDAFESIVRHLPEGVHRTIIRRYVRDEMLMRDIGASLGFSESRVSQIYKQAMAILKAGVRA
jgi:RNA polymerase sigma factor for flagellar operon FliA